MDIIAHGLWTAALYAAINKKRMRQKKARLPVLRAAVWGIFPDLFAFTLPWTFIIIGLLRSDIHPANIPGPDSIEPPAPDAFPSSIFNLATSLYNISHSALVFAAVIFIVWLIRKRIPWEMGGWLFHIAIDIPTHSTTFFPTPVAWPLSGWTFPYGIPWHKPWFFALNYAALLALFIFLRYTGKSPSKSSAKTQG